MLEGITFVAKFPVSIEVNSKFEASKYSLPSSYGCLISSFKSLTNFGIGLSAKSG